MVKVFNHIINTLHILYIWKFSICKCIVTTNFWTILFCPHLIVSRYLCADAICIAIFFYF